MVIFSPKCINKHAERDCSINVIEFCQIFSLEHATMKYPPLGRTQIKTCFKLPIFKLMVRINLRASRHLLLLGSILNHKTLLGISIGREILMKTLFRPKNNLILHNQTCLVRPTIWRFNLISRGTTKIIINNTHCLFLLSTIFYLHYQTNHPRRHHHHWT